MHKLLIIGAGKIGSLAACLLANCKDYYVYLADLRVDQPELQRLAKNFTHLDIVEFNALDEKSLAECVKAKSITTIISCLPFYCNTAVANSAKKLQLHYFDLTEDRSSAQHIQQLAQDAEKAFVPQCGLAPGFISIIAHHLMQRFTVLDSVKMRVGALPINVSNALQYSMTWSTDGLINEYGNLCHMIEDGELVEALPLEALEEIKIDGLTYEAFTTSGGIGSLAQSYLGKVRSMNYKTIRYPGHCAKIRFLMNDLKLNHSRDTLKLILENVLPKTYQDVVLTYVSVTGKQDGQFIEENYVRKFYSQQIFGHLWSAIQLTTAHSLCAIVDLVLAQGEKPRCLIRQEQFSLEEFVKNRFGKFYAQ